ncbi:hypothetical protein, partial [Klebsiella pneumoniae]|uniref:hypothetical protein n=1 Tax=Klebsiella pneumoniae TaxID=573 RepID=UPI0034E989BC
TGNLTDWNKAIVFSGNTERTYQFDFTETFNPIQMARTSQLVSAPSTTGNTVSTGHPWATTVVFRTDGNASDQYIWTQGEGTASTNDNIYLRLDSNGAMYFGWGRQG